MNNTEKVEYKKDEIIDERKPSYEGFIRKVVTKQGNYVYTTDYPTGNCQLSSISYFNALINGDRYNKEYVLRFLMDLKKAGRILNILLCDIHQALLPQLLKKIDKKYIITKTNYTSTNNSKMCIVLINVVKICNDYYANTLSLK